MGARHSIPQIQQEPLPGGPIGAGGGRDQLAPTPYQLPRLARPEGCCDMSCDCLSKYHGRASRDALRAWSGWASTVIHGPRYEPDYGPRYEQDYGPRYASGRRAALRAGPPGRATRRAAGPRYASGRRAALHAGPPGRATRRAAGLRYAPDRGPRCTPDQLQRHRTAGPSDQRTEDADTYQWTSRPRAPGVYSRIHVPYAGTTLGGRTRTAGVYYTPLDRTTRAASSACTC